MLRYLAPNEHEVGFRAMRGVVDAVKAAEAALQTVLPLLDCIEVHYDQTQARTGPSAPPASLPPHPLKVSVGEMRSAFTDLENKVELIRLKFDGLITHYNWASNAPTTGRSIEGVVQRLNHIINSLRQ